MNSPLKVLFTLAPVKSEAAQDIQLRSNFCLFIFHQVVSADFVPPEKNDQNKMKIPKWKDLDNFLTSLISRNRI